MRTLICILVFLSLGCPNAFATSVVAVRSDDEIIIGADSKTTLTRAKETAAGPESLSKCKITQAGSLFFASAGAAGIGPDGPGRELVPELDLKDTISHALQGSGGLDEKVTNLENVIVADLTRIAEEARQENAGFFLKRFLRHPAHTVVIGGTENGKLVLMVRTFRLIIAPSGALSFEIGRFSCPGDCRTSFITIFEGQTGAIRDYLQQHGLFLYFAEPVTAVRDLVELEISQDPSSVGPPVDILRLTKKGAEWIQRKSLCPDIQTSSVLPEGEAGTNNQ